MSTAEVAALCVAGAACVTDVASRRVPNALTVSAMAGALVLAGFESGWSGIGRASAGLAVGLLVYLPLFALRGMGGGDVKLMGALGALAGSSVIVWTALFAALAGGVMAVGLATAKGGLTRAFRNVGALIVYWRAAGLRVHPGLSIDTPGAMRLPYALPIAIGLVVALWWR